MAKIKRICSIEGCGKRHRSKGYCIAHHARWLRHGDPLSGRTPVGELYRYLRDVVLAYDGDECLLWPYSKDSDGYGQIKHGQKVHRFVCKEQNGEPPSSVHQAAHSCGNGHLGCATRRHLAWKTPAENSADMIEHGRSARGQKHHRAKLHEEQVLMIRSLRGKFVQRDIASAFGVSQAIIHRIHARKAWAWL